MKPARLTVITCFILTGLACGICFASFPVGMAIFTVFLSAYAIKLSK